MLCPQLVALLQLRMPCKHRAVFVPVSVSCDDNLPVQWDPHRMRVYNQLPRVHISKYCRVETQPRPSANKGQLNCVLYFFMTTDIPLFVRIITKVRDGRDIQNAPARNKCMLLVRFLSHGSVNCLNRQVWNHHMESHPRTQFSSVIILYHIRSKPDLWSQNIWLLVVSGSQRTAKEYRSLRNPCLDVISWSN
jgi:hypothetical protein